MSPETSAFMDVEESTNTNLLNETEKGPRVAEFNSFVAQNATVMVESDRAPGYKAPFGVLMGMCAAEITEENVEMFFSEAYAMLVRANETEEKEEEVTDEADAEELTENKSEQKAENEREKKSENAKPLEAVNPKQDSPGVEQSQPKETLKQKVTSISPTKIETKPNDDNDSGGNDFAAFRVEETQSKPIRIVRESKNIIEVPTVPITRAETTAAPIIVDGPSTRHSTTRKSAVSETKLAKGPPSIEPEILDLERDEEYGLQTLETKAIEGSAVNMASAEATALISIEEPPKGVELHPTTVHGPINIENDTGILSIDEEYGLQTLETTDGYETSEVEELAETGELVQATEDEELSWKTLESESEYLGTESERGLMEDSEIIQTNATNEQLWQTPEELFALKMLELQASGVSYSFPNNPDQQFDLPDYSEVGSEVLTELTMPIEAVEQNILLIAERIEELDVNEADTAHQILDEVIQKVVEAQKPVESELDNDDIAFEKVELEIELEKLFVRLFEITGIEYTPDLLDSCVKLALTGDVKELLAKIEQQDESSLLGKGTHEVIKHILSAISTIKKAAQHACLIGKSVLSLYFHQFEFASA